MTLSCGFLQTGTILRHNWEIIIRSLIIVIIIIIIITIKAYTVLIQTVLSALQFIHSIK